MGRVSRRRRGRGWGTEGGWQPALPLWRCHKGEGGVCQKKCTLWIQKEHSSGKFTGIGSTSFVGERK